MVQEHEILAQARESLDSSPADTLSRVAEHQQHFPDGALTSERELLRILALARLGRMPEARAARDAFLARWPTSAYRSGNQPRGRPMKKLCAGRQKTGWARGIQPSVEVV